MMRLSWVILVSVAVVSAKVSYEGHRVLRIYPETLHQVEALKSLERTEAVDFWKEATRVGQAADVRLSPAQYEHLTATFDSGNWNWTVILANLKEAIDGERPYLKRSSRDVLTSYASTDEINQWLQTQAIQCGSRCALMNFGTSVEGRAMKVIKITGSDKAENKPAVFVDGGIHAREWISPVFVNNMISKLINDYDSDTDVQTMLSTFDWYLIPLLNPDGYTYSQEDDRMWRKNRAPTHKKRCKGVDLNRNFGYQWGVAGVSTNPCAETYLGPNAFSEPESQALKDFLANLDLEVYFTFHAYGQYILYPWGYGQDYADNHYDLTDVANDGRDAIKSINNEDYIVGTAAIALYPAAGGSDDWALGGAGASYAYTVELPPDDNDSAGFILPENRIPSVISSVWPGVKAMMKSIMRKKFSPSLLDGKPKKPLPPKPFIPSNNGILHGKAKWKVELRKKLAEQKNSKISLKQWEKKYERN